jgi:PAS domain S-box-containing protein
MEKAMRKSGINQPNRRQYALEKSFKELQCLYDIARITSDPDLTLEEQLATIAHLLPRALHYPELAFASITMKNQQFRTGNYADTSRKISADIFVQGARAGSVEVGYTKVPPVADNNLLSKQERLLLDAVAERLGAVTEQKQYQELLNTIYYRAPLGIYIMQDGKLQYTNPQFQKITGYSQPELLGRELFSLIAVEDSDVVRASNIYSLEAENPYPCEYRILNKTGQIKWVMQTVSPIHYQGKEAVLGNVMDITERKYLERKVIEYEELSKMKSDLLSTVSHELRTPLATIKGYSTMILDYYARLSSVETKDYLKSIDSSADRLSKLVDNLLDTSRMEAGLLRLKKAPTNISQLIKGAASEARIRAGQHHITVTMSHKLPLINIDAKRIRQVVDNLIDNAIKYSPPETDVLLSARKAGRELLISVADQGPGIPAGELTNIFDRMYRIEQRLHSGMDGIGLGLYICQRLVEAHGGRIWAESTLGKGSTINLTLPIEKTAKEIKPLTRSVIPEVYLS